MPIHVEHEVILDNQVPNGGMATLKARLYLAALQGPLSFLLDGRDYVIRVGNVKSLDVITSGQLIEGVRDYQLTIHYWLAEPSKAAAGDIVYHSILRVDPGLGDDEQPRATSQGKVFHPHSDGWQFANPVQ